MNYKINRKPELDFSHAMMISVVGCLSLLVLSVYIANGMRDSQGLVTSNGGLLILFSIIGSFALLIWVWAYHHVMD